MKLQEEYALRNNSVFVTEQAKRMGAAIRQRRNELGLTQAQVEELTGGRIKQAVLSKWERGDTARHDAEMLALLLAALRTNPEDVFGEDAPGWLRASKPPIAAETRPRSKTEDEILDVSLLQIETLQKCVVLLAGERGVSAGTRRAIQALLKARKAG